MSSFLFSRIFVTIFENCLSEDNNFIFSYNSNKINSGVNFIISSYFTYPLSKRLLKIIASFFIYNGSRKITRPPNLFKTSFTLFSSLNKSNILLVIYTQFFSSK